METLLKAKKNMQAIFLSIASILCFMFLTNGNMQAAQVPINGAGAKDAVITDSSGKNVTGQSLNEYTYYTATYNWSLPSDTTVKSGDTATFTLPSDVQVRTADTTFNVNDKSGQVVGKFTIQKDSSVGTLTFNDYFSKNNIKDIHGVLKITVSGTQGNSATNWALNKSGWLDSQNVPNWTVIYNPNSESLTNVKINDSLQNGQTFNVDSIQLWYGHVTNNQFVADQKITNPVSQGLVTLSNGNTNLTAKFDKLDKAVQLVYKTNANTLSGNYSLTNDVNASSDQLGSTEMTSTIAVGGNGIAEGTANASTSSMSSSSNVIPSHSGSSSMSSSSNVIPSHSSSSSMSSSSNVIPSHSSSSSLSSSSNVTSSHSSSSSLSSSSGHHSCRPQPHPHHPCRPHHHHHHPCGPQPHHPCRPPYPPMPDYPCGPNIPVWPHHNCGQSDGLVYYFNSFNIIWVNGNYHYYFGHYDMTWICFDNEWSYREL